MSQSYDSEVDNLNKCAKYSTENTINPDDELIRQSDSIKNVKIKTMVQPNSMLGVKIPSYSLNPQDMTHRFGAKSDFTRYF